MADIDDTKEAVMAFAQAYLHKAIDESPTHSVSMSTDELESFVNEPGSTQLALNYDEFTNRVIIGHIRLDDQKH